MCFELFGFDILIDYQHEPWLLEVNQSPSFATETDLDKDIKTNLIKDTFKILGYVRNRYGLVSKGRIVEERIIAETEH